MAAGMGRSVSSPNAIGSRWTKRQRRVWASSHRPQGGAPEEAQVPDRQRDEVVESVAGGQHERGDPLGVSGNDVLGNGDAGVAGHQHHVIEPCREEPLDNPCDPGQREVRAGAHPEPVRTEWPVRCHAMVVEGEIRDDSAPDICVGNDAVEEDHDGASALSADTVLDAPVFDLEGARLAQRDGPQRRGLRAVRRGGKLAHSHLEHGRNQSSEPGIH